MLACLHLRIGRYCIGREASIWNIKTTQVEADHCLSTSVTEDLQTVLPWINPSSGQIARRLEPGASGLQVTSASNHSATQPEILVYQGFPAALHIIFILYPLWKLLASCISPNLSWIVAFMRGEYVRRVSYFVAEVLSTAVDTPRHHKARDSTSSPQSTPGLTDTRYPRPADTQHHIW